MHDEYRPDFRVNKEWFDVKIVTDGTRANSKKEMGKRAYTDMIRKVFDSLRLISHKFGHWGRVNAPVELEFMDIPSEFIRMLGKCVSLCVCVVYCLFFTNG
jgi:hypothetical protein